LQLAAERRRNTHLIAGENPGNLFTSGSAVCFSLEGPSSVTANFMRQCEIGNLLLLHGAFKLTTRRRTDLEIWRALPVPF
jgi:hypothetical protein